MPKKDKSEFTGKQKRRAKHIEEDWEKKAFLKKRCRAARGQP